MKWLFDDYVYSYMLPGAHHIPKFNKSVWIKSQKHTCLTPINIFYLDQMQCHSDGMAEKI